MKPSLKLTLKLMFASLLLLANRAVQGQDPTYTASISNDVMISSNVYEFDLYLIRTGSVALEMANFQAAITIDPAFRNGGTITPVFVSGSSELNAAQIPSSISFSATQNCIKIAPKLPPRTLYPGSGTSSTAGTIISTTGTKVCRVQLTNSGSFGNMPLSPVWSFVINPYRTLVSAFVGPATAKVNTNITLAASHSKTLNLKLLTEGLYNSGSGKLNKTQDADIDGNTWDKFTGLTADQVTIELAEATSPFNIIHTVSGINVNTDGSCRIPLPGTLSANYYVVVKHRNSVETWSKMGGESFSGNITSYDLTSAAAQSFGDNLKAVSGGMFALYSGEVSSSTSGVQDGYIDFFDLNDIHNLNLGSAYGYQSSDITGDGFVDFFDLNMVYNNNLNSIGMNTPPNPAKKKM